MILKHVCLECGWVGDVVTDVEQKVICPNCGTLNDWWLEGAPRPKNHM